MAYSDILRSSTGVDNEDVADLIDGVYPTWTDWTPTLTPAGSMTYTSTTINFARYIQIGKLVHYKVNFEGTVGGTPSSYISFSLPVTAVNQQPAGSVQLADNSIDPVLGIITFSSVTAFAVWRYNIANYTAGTVGIRAYGFYEAA